MRNSCVHEKKKKNLHLTKTNVFQGNDPSKMEDAVTCGVCSEFFEKGIRDPLVLPCGHTFCRSCVMNVRRTGNFLCPICRQTHNNVDVNKLLINYSLLSLSSNYEKFQVSKVVVFSLCGQCRAINEKKKLCCTTRNYILLFHI